MWNQLQWSECPRVSGAYTNMQPIPSLAWPAVKTTEWCKTTNCFIGTLTTSLTICVGIENAGLLIRESVVWDLGISVVFWFFFSLGKWAGFALGSPTFRNPDVTPSIFLSRPTGTEVKRVFVCSIFFNCCGSNGLVLCTMSIQYCRHLTKQQWQIYMYVWPFSRYPSLIGSWFAVAVVSCTCTLYMPLLHVDIWFVHCTLKSRYSVKPCTWACSTLHLSVHVLYSLILFFIFTHLWQFL